MFFLCYLLIIYTYNIYISEFDANVVNVLDTIIKSVLISCHLSCPLLYRLLTGIIFKLTTVLHEFCVDLVFYTFNVQVLCLRDH